MKPPLFFQISVVLFLLLFILPLFAFSEPAPFVRNLGLGDSGADVVALQRVLNSDPDTRVALAGPGSPGFETAQFGLLTRAAVVKFQKKYTSEILAPGVAPTGFVGPKTLKKLNAVVLARASAPPPPSSKPPAMVESRLRPLERTADGQARIPPSPGGFGGAGTNYESRLGQTTLQTGGQSITNTELKPTTPPTVSAPAGNPNFVNLDKFISAVQKAGKQKGYSESKLNTVTERIKTAAAGTMDFRKEFAKARAKAKHVGARQDLSPRPLSLGGMVKRLLSSLGILPHTAEAQAGIPFGGAVYYVFFCDCSWNWLVEIEPLPPTYATLLTYYEGTQEYLNYNAPFTNEMLGFYDYGGECVTEPEDDCDVILPSDGEITGTLGSSAI